MPPPPALTNLLSLAFTHERKALLGQRRHVHPRPNRRRDDGHPPEVKIFVLECHVSEGGGYLFESLDVPLQRFGCRRKKMVFKCVFNVPIAQLGASAGRVLAREDSSR
jgi:hypothetical protein